MTATTANLQTAASCYVIIEHAIVAQGKIDLMWRLEELRAEMWGIARELHEDDAECARMILNAYSAERTALGLHY